MIKRFFQLNEDVSKYQLDINFFKKLFEDLIDHDYSVKIERINYVKKLNTESDAILYDESNFPKKGYYACYRLKILTESTFNRLRNSEEILKYSEKILKYSEVLQSLSDVVKRIENDPDLDIKGDIHEGNSHFIIEIIDLNQIPESDLPDELIEEFYLFIDNIVWSCGYTSKVKITKNYEKQQLEIESTLTTSQSLRLLKEMNRWRKYSTQSSRFHDCFSFDIENIERKHDSYKAILKNPVKVNKNN